MDGRDQDERRLIYQRVNETIRYAHSSNANGDGEGECMALKHAVELVCDLLEKFYFIAEKGAEAVNGVELDGVREMPREVQDIQDAGPAEEEGTPEAHVVPVVQGGDAASGEVLKMNPKPVDSKKHGLTGDNPKASRKAQVFKLYSVDASGKDVKLIDTGTAAELCNRNGGINPKWIYNNAGKNGRAGNAYRAERVKE